MELKPVRQRKRTVNVMSEGEVAVKYEPFKEIVIMEKDYFASADEIARFASIIAGG